MKKYENPLMRSMAKLILKKMDKIMPTILEAKQRMRGEASSWFERGLIEANQKKGGNSNALEYYKKAV